MLFRVYTLEPSSSTSAVESSSFAQTLGCCLILSRIDCCNAVLHGAPSYSIKMLQRVQNNAARIVLEAPRRSHASPLLRTLHWLPVQHAIDYKLVQIPQHVDAVVPLSPNPGSRTQPQPAIGHYDAVLTLHNDDFAKRACQYCAPAGRNSLRKTVLNSIHKVTVA